MGSPLNLTGTGTRKRSMQLWSAVDQQPTEQILTPGGAGTHTGHTGHTGTDGHTDTGKKTPGDTGKVGDLNTENMYPLATPCTVP